jgi:cytochrome b
MNNKSNYLVWDLPIRVFHWSIVILICFSWYCIEIAEDLDKHFISGYCVLTLIIFRIIWGFLGTHHARFSNMLYKPTEIKIYLKSFFSRKANHYSGHNPLGSLSVVMLLGLLSVQALSGLFANDEDYYFGPFSDYVSTKTSDRLTEIHHINFDILIVFIVLHICAVIFYLLFKKENLFTAMITGRKKVSEGNNKAIVHSKLIVALLTLIFSASAVYLLVTYA